VPWRRPEALLAVRDDAAVRERLLALAHGHHVGDDLVRLLATLLDPDPSRRGDGDPSLSRRIALLHAGARARQQDAFAARWSIPARWPYRGLDPQPFVDAARSGTAPRLVVVAGAAHSGRTRYVEELIQRLQSAGHPAQLGDERQLAGDGEHGGWLDAWLGDTAPVWMGLRESPRVPGESPAQQAATLLAAAALARTTAVLPVSLELADALERAHPGARVAIVRTRPWSAAELEAAITEVVDVDRSGWTEAVLELTGGWSARAVRAVSAAARAGLDRPDRGALESLLAAPGGELDEDLDDALAHDVLVAAWTGQTAARIPAHLRGSQGPWASVVAAAHARLGDRGAALARTELERVRALGQPIGLRLAIAADDAAEVDASIRAAVPLPGRRCPAGLLEDPRKTRNTRPSSNAGDHAPAMQTPTFSMPGGAVPPGNHSLHCSAPGHVCVGSARSQ
jgi:hypothetical protein